MKRLVTLLAFVVVAGCSGITTENGDRIEGTYTLRSIDGRALPAQLSGGPEQLTVTASVLTLEGDGDWAEVLSYSMVENGQVVPKTLNDGGQWTVRSRSLDLLGVGGSQLFGTFSSFSGPRLDLYRMLGGSQRHAMYAR